jgi:hypothetical protein
MKKTLLAFLLAPCLAFGAEGINKPPPQSTSPSPQGAGQTTSETGQSVHASPEHQDVGTQIKDNVNDLERQAGLKKNDSLLFRSGQAYELNGTVSQVKFGKVTIAREGLPNAVLDIKDGTQVQMDGRSIDAKYLPEGAQVRAKFQLDGNDGVALKIDATSTRTEPHDVR